MYYEKELETTKGSVRGVTGSRVRELERLSLFPIMLGSYGMASLRPENTRSNQIQQNSVPCQEVASVLPVSGDLDVAKNLVGSRVALRACESVCAGR